MARHGKARHGKAGRVWRGEAWLGGAWRDLAWQAWQGRNHMGSSLQFGRWIRKSDKSPVTRVGITFVIDGDQAGVALAAAAKYQIDPLEWLAQVGRGEATRAVRDQLSREGSDGLNWALDGLDAAEAETWRKAGVAAARRLWPAAFEKETK